MDIKKQFWKFVLPSMLTMLLNGLYTIVDGFFIGHAVGDVGLAGIGIAWPVTAVLIALGMGIGVGGSVTMSVFRGTDNHNQANEARANTILVLVIVSILMTILLTLFCESIIRLLGASGEVLIAAESYTKIIALGGSMQIIASGLLPIIRNSHQTIQAMIIMGTGLICNIILDACFTMIIPMGLGGAALATITSQFITVVGCIICFTLQKEHKIKLSQFHWNWSITRNIFKIGISPFGLSLMPSLITAYNNWQCIAYGGNLAVSAYSIINYFTFSVLLLLEGIGEGMQPLISYCKGAGDYPTMKYLRNRGLLAVFIFSSVFLVTVIPARTILPVFFGASKETAEIIKTALPILCIAFPMMGLGKLFTSYFYACEKTVYSTLLVYIDPILWTPVCITILPRIFGLKGVWSALPAAQALTMLLLITCLLIDRKTKIGGKALCSNT